MDYAENITSPVTVLMGGVDDKAGVKNVAKMTEFAKHNSSLNVKVYPHSDHGFLANLDSPDSTLKQEACAGLSECIDTLNASD